MSESANTRHGQRSDPPPHAPIGRGVSARARVLEAALDVLADQGLSGFTMEAVADRAGASKATVYRRWPSRTTLLADALEQVSQPLPRPATGQLRSDLIELVTGLQTLMNDQPLPQMMAAFIDAAERDPALATLHAKVTERRLQPVRQVLREARQRGDIPPTADLELAIDLLVGAIFYRRFGTHKTFHGHYATRLVDHVLTAIGTGQRAWPQTGDCGA